MELLTDAHAELGEGPSWHAEKQALYWVDIIKHRIYCYNAFNDTQQIWELPEAVSCVVPREKGNCIVALESSLAIFMPDTGELETIVSVGHAHADMRFNDGKCDPAGRLWAGTMDGRFKDPVGKLYCLDIDHTLRVMESGVTISNGLTWNPDATQMYYIDTPTQQVVAYDYELDSGSISNRRVAITVPKKVGMPDGMTIDREGMLWIAMWHGSKITRWNPNSGELLATYATPACNTTSCCFGGADFQDLYITTARTDTTDEQLAAQPQAGGLFRMRTDFAGIPTYLFKG